MLLQNYLGYEYSVELYSSDHPIPYTIKVRHNKETLSIQPRKRDRRLGGEGEGGVARMHNKTHKKNSQKNLQNNSQTNSQKNSRMNSHCSSQLETC